MCGIAGQVSFKGNQNIDDLRQQLKIMLATIAHRGPDDESIWVDENGLSALGHRRLSIIDVSERANQPMHSSCSRYICAFNGEIYNYIELRDYLISKGAIFKTQSDTEVLVEMFAFLGVDETLRRIDGMFSISLWDRKNSSLYLIRDRVGKKPLYFSFLNNTLTFASEIKAIVSNKRESLNINLNSLSEFFKLGYIPGNDTIYEEIKEIRPGHVLEFSSKGINEKPYWAVPFNQEIAITYQDALQEADRLLRLAINKRLRSDVPLGFFLSGGIDSGLIVALASELSSNKLSTYTVSFEGSEFDESSAANLVAKKFNTNHQTLRAEIELERDILFLVNQYDEPFGDSSAIPTMAVCREASNDLKVALSGDGGDEVFGGYRRAIAARMAVSLNRFGFKLPNASLALLKSLSLGGGSYRNKFSFMKRFFSGLQEDSLQRYLIWAANGTGHASKEIFKTDFLKQQESVLNQFLFQDQNIFQQITALDFNSQLPDALLVKMDIASMAHGLEVRAPFLDKDLIEFGMSLPMNIKIRNFKSKSLLRDLASSYLPKNIYSAPKKGFEIPLDAWLSNNLSSMVQDIFSSKDSITYDIFKEDYINSLPLNTKNIDTHQWSNQLWNMLMFRLWEEMVHKA
jgi:asparagine synthase (glutamine-hydrolysing)